jgi:hypothetical protein
MGVTGTWQQRSAQPYARGVWGLGYNPVHEIRDSGRGRAVQSKLNLLPLGEPAAPISETLTSRDLDWLSEDYVVDPAQSEDLGYLDQRPDWGSDPSVYRTDLQMAGGVWLPPDADDYPLRGTAILGQGRGETGEARTATNTVIGPVSGSWLGKIRGEVLLTEAAQVAGQPGYQPTINNGEVQGPGRQSYTNDRATGRGTDAARTPIVSPLVGQSLQAWPVSLANGGGPTVPDLRPYQQTAGFQRPWFPRAAATPPAEAHTFGELEGRFPIQRTLPPDPWTGDPESQSFAPDEVDGGWGY